MVRIYRSAYARRTELLSKAEIDSMPPAMSRIKTEIDEVNELIETAKRKGASAWGSMKDRVQSALDRLTSNYRDTLFRGTK